MTMCRVQSLTEIDALIAEGLLGEAEAGLTAMVDQHSLRMPALERLARISERRGDWQAALERWRLLAAEDPAAILPIICQTDLLRIAGDIAGARALIERLAGSAEMEAEVLKCRARLASADRAWDEALALLRQAQVQGADTLDVALGVVDALTEAQRLTEAEAALAALPDGFSGEALVLERQARLLFLTGDWDSCFAGLRPLLFRTERPDWAIHQAFWILVELRRFEELAHLRADLCTACVADDRIGNKLRWSAEREAEFSDARAAFEAGWNAHHSDVPSMVDAVRHIGANDARLGDAGAWYLYARYPNNFDVLRLMADPPLIQLSEHRAAYFRRMIYLRHPGREESLLFHIKNLFSVKQYHQVAQAVERFGYARLSRADLLQIALMSEDIAAVPSSLHHAIESCKLTNSGYVDILRERAKNIELARAGGPAIARRGASGAIRLALCISGQLRGYQECFPSAVQHVVQRFPTDVFVQTWAKVGNARGAHGARLHRLLPADVAQEIPAHWSDQEFFARNPRTQELLMSTEMVTEQELARVMYPAACRIEDEEAFEADSASLQDADFGPTMNQYKLFFQMARCLQRARVEDTDCPYDLVIWVRPDIRLRCLHIQPLIEACLERDFIVTSFLPPLAVGDFIIVGTPRNMRAVASLWPWLRANGGYQDHRLAAQGLGPYLLCNHLFRMGRKVCHTDMFHGAGTGPHGAKPNLGQLLRSMLLDAAARGECLPFELRALTGLVQLNAGQSASPEHQQQLRQTVAALTADKSWAEALLSALPQPAPPLPVGGRAA